MHEQRFKQVSNLKNREKEVKSQEKQTSIEKNFNLTHS